MPILLAFLVATATLLAMSESTLPAPAPIPEPASAAEQPETKLVPEDAQAFAQLVPQSSKLRKLAGGFKFTEGPVWVGEKLIFSDIRASRLYAWDGESITLFREGSHRANGNTLDRLGRLVTCEHESRVVSLTNGGDRRVLLEHWDKGRFNSPNDVVVKSDGTIWFTDPSYGLPGNRRQELMEYDGRYVFRFDPGDGSVLPVVTDFDMPNGLCFSPDESKLYIADSGKPKHIRVFDVHADGSLSGGEVFAEINPGVPDGMRVDTQGNLWSTAGDGIHIFSRDGKRLGRILVPETPTNVEFGGEGGSTLFITAQTGLYAIETNVRGAD